MGCYTALSGIDPETQERCYSARAYYLPASHRKNLILLTEAMVRSVILDQTNNSKQWTATGVRFSHRGNEYTVFVEGEVIISAGSVQSPQILELSGIGDPTVLRAAGIETRLANSNVGENLQEHMRRTTIIRTYKTIG